MINWLNSADPVIIFRNKQSAIFNKAANALFDFSANINLKSPLQILSSEQAGGLSAAECWLHLSEQVIRKSLVNAKLIVNDAHGREIDCEVLLINQQVGGSEGNELVTKWLPSLPLGAKENVENYTYAEGKSVKYNVEQGKIKKGLDITLEEAKGKSLSANINPIEALSKQAIQCLNTNDRRSDDDEGLLNSADYLQLARLTSLGEWQYNLKDNTLTLNSRAAYLLTGNTDSISLSSDEFIHEYFTKDAINKIRYVMQQIRNCRQLSYSDVIDVKLHNYQGNLISILVSIWVDFNTDGQLKKVQGLVQDINKVRFVEQELEGYRNSLERLVELRTNELRYSEAKLADALKLAQLGTWEFNKVQQQFEVNEGILEILGTTKEIEGGLKIKYDRIKEFICPEDYGIFREVVLNTQEVDKEGYTKAVEFRIHRPNAQVRNIYLSIKSIREKNGVKFIGTMQDITLMRQAEREKDQLSQIIETTSDIVGIAGIDGRITYLNEAGRHFFGIGKSDALATHTFKSFQNKQSARILNKDTLNYANDKGTWAGENFYLRFDGEEVPVSQVVVSHKNSEGVPVCYSTIIRDISQQKNTERDLVLKNNELDTFIYRASHDLRGPIATMMGLHNIAEFEIKDENALKFLELYRSQVLRLNAVTVSLTEITKIKDYQVKLKEEHLSVLVKSVVSEIQQSPESADVIFEMQVDPALSFCTDAHLFKVILTNLVENSVRYKQKEIESSVRVEVTKVEEGIELKVSDNGIGINADLQHKIYNMFFKATENAKGPGLGLHILKYAVEKLKGVTQLYSVPYKGTTFKIFFPQA